MALLVFPETTSTMVMTHGSPDEVIANLNTTFLCIKGALDSDKHVETKSHLSR